MAPTLEEVTTKTGMVEIDPKKGLATKGTPENILPTEEAAMMEPEKSNNTNGDQLVVKDTATGNAPKSDAVLEEDNEVSKDQNPTAEASEAKSSGDVVVKEEMMKKEENVPVQTEPKTGVSFPVRLDDGKQLNAVGMRKKTILGLGIKIYGFGMYADNEKLKELLRSKIGTKAPSKPSKEMYQLVIDSDVGMMVRLVIVFGSLTMNMVKKNFDEGLGGSIKKLNGGKKNEELANKVMGAASDDIKLSAGSVIEITRLPGFILETKVKDEVVSKVQSELLCRAYVHMYLGDDPFDKEAKERFGMSLLSMF
ncbi:fatty-acid-binding protein 1-like [Papaver somniferum]|uniref:fatty-acid-binding protein 1-like n=1 Tax=Papaver somniferum TaxID=3469 RepID=UPI000E6FFEAD|nr:fatty-acid-binding protein 1-like [Papaver somniferum]